MRYTVWQRGLATSHTAPFFSTATAFHILLSAVHTPFLILTSLLLQLGTSSRAIHGGAYFSAVSGRKFNLTTVLRLC